MADATTVVAAVSSFFAAVSATAAWFNVRTVLAGRREDREAARPYFTNERMTLRATADDPPHIFNIVFRNVGRRPAHDLRLQLLFVAQDLDEETIGILHWALANDVPGGTSFRFGNKAVLLYDSPEAQFIVVRADYHDRTLSRDFSQLFFLEWGGTYADRQALVGVRKLHKIFDASAENRDRITERLKNDYADFFSQPPPPPAWSPWRSLRRR